MANDERSRLVRRVVEYPYQIYKHSYAIVGNKVHRLVVDEAALPESRGDSHPVVEDPLRYYRTEFGLGFEGCSAARTPVLAYGSNQSPAQLHRKFRGAASELVIPVTRCEIEAFDAVYSAYITPYGSVPATLVPSHGTQLSASVVWLDRDQLEIMDATERKGDVYDFGMLKDARLRLDGLIGIGGVYCYVNLFGALILDGTAWRLSAIECANPRFPSLTEGEVLARLQHHIGNDLSFDEFIYRLGTYEEFRDQLRRILLHFGSHYPDIIEK